MDAPWVICEVRTYVHSTFILFPCWFNIACTVHISNSLSAAGLYLRKWPSCRSPLMEYEVQLCHTVLASGRHRIMSATARFILPTQYDVKAFLVVLHDCLRPGYVPTSYFSCACCLLRESHASCFCHPNYVELRISHTPCRALQFSNCLFL